MPTTKRVFMVRVRVVNRLAATRGGALAGAAAAGWMVALPRLLAATGWHAALPLGVRIPVLALVECFPAGFALSLLTPVAIKLGLPDVRRAGRAAGRVFAVGTLGCLAGNYATGFYLIPAFTLDAIAGATAGVLLAAAGFSFFLPSPRWGEGPGGRGHASGPVKAPPRPHSPSHHRGGGGRSVRVARACALGL